MDDFSDFLAFPLTYLIKPLYLNRKRYISNNKRNNNMGRWLWEYMIYTLLRSFFYVIQLTNLISSLLVPYLLVFSVVFAWIIVSIMSILISRLTAIMITQR